MKKILLYLMASLIYPTEYYVSTLGDSLNTGTFNSPFLHVQQAVDIIKAERKASTSFLQRKLQIGYNRAARIMETMEKEGIVGRANHVGKREIL